MAIEETYNFSKIEKKWQTRWDKEKTFKTLDKSNKPKYYILDMFPYPSGNGLHVGHVEGYTATDVIARFKRMQGFNVLHPMGWDAFGLPAEQYALKTGTHPEITTKKNIKTFKEQIKKIGFSCDWDREINTTDPEYYKWTQWIFLKLYEKGLAYESYAPVNWCPHLGTVLANEEVIDGKSEVGGFPVEKKPIRQWVLKITEYADRLLDDLDDLDWPESTKEMQRNWIGRNIGANIHFKLENHSDSFTVFTTRADTLFGASFCVLAPEHPLVEKITTPDFQDQVEEYIHETKNKSDNTRLDHTREKTGVPTGAFAINPANNEKLPIYIADYVLMTYGTGAIMAVPAHDQRDHDFAKKYKLKIKQVISGETKNIDEQAHTEGGTLINSEFLNGLDSTSAQEKMISYLEKKELGNKTTNYRLRDWVFSRQRYWGEPFPLMHDKEGNCVLIDEKDLPVTLPQMEDYKPSQNGEPPLAKANEWVNIKNGSTEFKRETNIMPQWAGSCWYYLRYIDPKNSLQAWSQEKEKHWLPVDLYVGGVEHANLHLLYARFWHKVLYDLGYVSTKEPFKKVIHPGLVLGPNGEKMSKSRGNVVNPDDVIKDWGADSLRLFELFLGPLDQVKPWQTKGITGSHRFLKRVYRLLHQDSTDKKPKIVDHEESMETKRVLHKTIKKVTEDTSEMRFNTAISSMMEFINYAYKQESLSKTTISSFTLLLAPYAPHIAEEIWEILQHSQSISHEPWPEYDENYIVSQTNTLCVMINGKNRGTITVNANAEKEEVIELAKSQDFVKRNLMNKQIKKEIYIEKKIINFVL